MAVDGLSDFDDSGESFCAHVVDLVARHHAPDGAVVLDLGCRFGAVADAVTELGLTYLGVCVEPAAVRAIVARGQEALVGDVGSAATTLRELVEPALAGRPLAAICLLNVVEHLVDAEGVLGAVHQFAADHGGPPLVVSIPNVTHHDVAVKLLMGRWDGPPTGPSGATPSRFFSEAGLTATMRQIGWTEVGAHDFERPYSDQCFPVDAVPLQRHTPIGALLARLRTGSGGGPLVEQFVRAYRGGRPVGDDGGDDETEEPFLSVLVRTQGTRAATLVDGLLSLAAQTCQDFEVLVLPHDVPSAGVSAIRRMVAEFSDHFARRVRVLPVRGGGRAHPLNEGALAARGRYLATLDDDDVVFAHWVAELKGAATRAPGRLAHIGVAAHDVAERPGAWDGHDGYELIGKPRLDYPLHFDYASHAAGNKTPNNGYATPRRLVVDQGVRWDESLEVLEDWDFLLRASSLAGVEDCPTIGALIRIWKAGPNSRTAHDRSVWLDCERRVVERLDEGPLLMDRGSFSVLRAADPSVMAGLRHDLATARQALHETDQARHETDQMLHETRQALEAANRRNQELLLSTSWRLTRPVRAVRGIGRAVARRAADRRSPPRQAGDQGR